MTPWTGHLDWVGTRGRSAALLVILLPRSTATVAMGGLGLDQMVPYISQMRYPIFPKCKLKHNSTLCGQFKRKVTDSYSYSI